MAHVVVKFVVCRRGPQHTPIKVFDGPDAEHLSFCGELAMTHDGGDVMALLLGFLYGAVASDNCVVTRDTLIVAVEEAEESEGGE